MQRQDGFWQPSLASARKAYIHRRVCVGASQFRVRDDFRVLALCTVIRSEQRNMKAVLESKRDFLPLTFEPFEELARKEMRM